jgi:hypothetical protein
MPLVDVLDGPMQQTIQVFAYDDNYGPVRRPSCTINFKMNFAEIWDFNLEFLDWKTSSLQDKEKTGETMNPQL